jgi:hypothetical protein
VTVGLEVVQKSRPDLVDAAHVHPIGKIKAGTGNFPAETLLDIARAPVQKLCRRIIGLPQHTNPVDTSFDALTGLAGPCFPPI